MNINFLFLHGNGIQRYRVAKLHGITASPDLTTRLASADSIFRGKICTCTVTVQRVSLRIFNEAPYTGQTLDGDMLGGHYFLAQKGTCTNWDSLRVMARTCEVRVVLSFT
jgi:hypothetical protein